MDATGYSDIADAGVHRPGIEELDRLGILAGTECGPGRFCPDEPLQRWMMAVWLVRAVDGSEPLESGSSRFDDVETSQWWSPYVERLADLGITRGCSIEPVLFCPTDPVTREQMASFLVRAFHLSAASSAGFMDTQVSPHEDDINALAASEITKGCAAQPLLYCPTSDTTRAEMATFLTRALQVDPIPRRPGGSFAGISSGTDHVCGLHTDGQISCWGKNEYGQSDPPEGPVHPGVRRRRPHLRGDA